jgi:hypothetical protein
LANHRGDVVAADRWASRAEPLLPLARRGELHLSIDFFNHRFVSRHNLYDFSAAIPGNFLALIDFLDHRYHDQCDFGCTVEPMLGRLYGTIAQNFAFCGPAYLAETKRFAGKAIAAFGGEKIPEYREDALRQYSYLSYAWLDAGDYGQAETALLRCLHATGWPAVWAHCDAGQLTIFHHAAIARFLSDTGDSDKGGEYLSRCSHCTQLTTTRTHPMPLWNFNLGRIAGQANLFTTAAKFFTRSLALCEMNRNQPTLFIMALLPLSGLWRLGILEKTQYTGTLSEVIGAALKLNGMHFGQLRSLAPETLLRTVWEAPQRWFPFSYR